MGGLNFGTSGLRGLVTDLVGWPSFGYALASLRHVDAGRSPGDARRVHLGRDLRASSPAILDSCLRAAQAAGFEAVDCGALPTPALALSAFEAGCPAVMITGSHIPDDRNGLKFYRRDGEIDKGDEAGIKAAFEAIARAATAMPSGALPVRDAAAASAVSQRYRRRYADFFPPDALSGLRVGVFTHSTVGRDVLLGLVADLGGIATDLGRSEAFVPVDTEAHRPGDVAQIAAWAASGRFDAIVSADGDADRPLVADEAGRILRGDLVGLLTVRQFGLKTIVTPITSSSAIETSGIADLVMRTKVGSPYVIEGMQRAAAEGAAGIAGFEANGGFLLFSDIRAGAHTLAALPTRDAVLPILGVLSQACERGESVGAMVAGLKAGHACAHRLPEVRQELSAAFLARLSDDAAFRATFFAPVGIVADADLMDGFKAILASEATVHFRASGNAPELRCYVEAGSAEAAERLLAFGLSAAADEIAALG